METAANPLRILGKGPVRFPVKDATNAMRSVELKDVNYVPRVAHNLFSVIKALVNDGFKINIIKWECTLRHDGGGYVLSAPGGGGVDLYLLRGIGKRECALLANGNANTKEALRWHRRAGHPGVNAMRQLHQIYYDSGAVNFPKSQINDLFCESCIFAKSTRLPFSKAISKTATRPGEVFHTDIGVLPTSTFSGYRYFIVFVGEYTRYVFTFLMRKRDEVYHVYEDVRRKVKEKIKYIYTVVSEYNDEIKRVQSDNGKKYEKLARIIAKYDTRFRFTQAYTPQQNAMAERRIRMVMEKALCLLFDGHLSGALWGEAVMTSTYLINITPSAAIDMRSPYLLWNNRLPRITKLRTFGCAAYAWIPKDKRTELETHAVKGIFVGCDEESLGLEQPIQAGSAQVGETLLPVIIERGDDRTVVPQRAVSPRSGEIARTRTDHPRTWSGEVQTHGTAIGNRSEIQSHDDGHPTSVDASRSQADVHRKPTQSGHVRLQSNPIDSTRSRELPVLDERAVEWFQQFIADEVNKIHHNDKDSGQMSFLSRERVSCVPCHLNHCNYKYSRPVQHCVCWSQRDNSEYVTSMGAGVGECGTLCRECTGRQNGVASMVARTAESGGHNRAYPGRQGNVLKQESLAVANADKASGCQRRKRKREERLLNEQALVDAHRNSLQKALRGRKCPCCYEDEGAVALLARAAVSAVGYVQRGKEDHVCVLRKSLYGLKQVPRVWYYTFYEVMIAERFTRLVKDHCVFIKTRDNEICIISVYVDDLLVLGTKPFVAEIKEILKRRFQMTDLGGFSYLLGWHIERRRSERTIFVHQEKYATKVLDCFGLAQCRPVRSPEETSQKLSESDCPTTDAEKQEMEKFLYRKANYVVRGLKYLNGTRDYGITLGARDVINATLAHALSAYSDADYANNVDTRRSVSGYVTYLFGSSPISWRSSLQKLVTLSTTDAEYVALASTVQEVLYLKQVMLELGYDHVDPVRIGENDQATIRISKNPEHHGRCKHIDIRYFFIQERQQAQDIDVFYCPTDKMPADILTKALTPEVFCRLRELVGVRSRTVVNGERT
ncbi:unnamed protein product [Phytophthora fragariaefolia]|uniref:Unnamed protein product n=1 Tax=Phytophthora fragariaefolia TaxID=1490495 RepID=A0A9W7CZ06_9STRA|nr:unnamed protein product [Phytophthora fragariaefolia]